MATSFTSLLRRRPRPIRERQIRRRRIIVGTVTVLILGVLVYGGTVITRLPQFTLSAVEISGGETLSLSELESQVMRYLEGNHYLFIPKKFRYLYPRQDIITHLERNPRIHNVVVEVSGQTKLVMSFTEYQPYALLCSSAERQNCLFMTRDGYAYESAPSLAGGTLMRWYDETLTSLDIASSISIPEWQNLEEFARILGERYGFVVASIRYSVTRDVIFTSHTGAEIRISDTKDRSQSLADIDAIFMSDEYRHLKTDSFVYVDARFADKVYIKEKEIVPVENATTSLHESDES